MKLSIETYVMRHRFGDIKAIEMISKAGFDALDYSYYWVDEDSPILAFLKLVSEGNATILDLTDDILKWIREEKQTITKEFLQRQR